MSKKVFYVSFIFLGSLLLQFSFGCRQAGQKRSDLDDAYIKEGHKLAVVYCGACHIFPSPELLPKMVWEKSILPKMGILMNIRYKDGVAEVIPDLLKNIDSSIFPPKMEISVEDFMKIKDFYSQNSPLELRKQNRQPINRYTELFRVRSLEDTSGSFTTGLAIDTHQHVFYYSNGAKKATYVRDYKFRLIRELQSGNITTTIDIGKGEVSLTNIGHLSPKPKEKNTGNIMVVDESSQPRIVLDHLDRPTEAIKVDLDGDGKSDWLVCEFGFLRGEFSWYKNLQEGDKFEKRTIKKIPGALKAYVMDVNNDYKPDIWALFGQAEEGISLFINMGNGLFEEKKILQFPPMYGSSYFEFADMNGDGKPDIIYTCGDNADYSQIPKPYHGVYIFINKGNNEFKQSFFFPVYGCYKAIARDFDNDGDLDLACISFFADYENHAEESFIYLENKGDLQFEPYLVKDLPKGRWVSMSAGILKEGGYRDIIIGNLAVPYKNRNDWLKEWEEAPPVVLLQNNLGNIQN